MPSRRSMIHVFLALWLCAAGWSAPPRRLAIAAAADLQFALAELKEGFEKAHPGVEVSISHGASGNLYAQMANGAPFDLFLSADLGYPQKLAEAGAAGQDAVFRYARGHLALWVPKDSPIPLEALGMKALLHPAAKKVAIANPRHAPYGRAAEAALRASGLLEQVQPRLVFGENVGQAAQFVQAGGASIGLIALSLAKAPAMASSGRMWEVPADAHPPLEQGGAILNQAKNRADALAFRDFMRSAEGCRILQRHGFQTDFP